MPEACAYARGILQASGGVGRGRDSRGIDFPKSYFIAYACRGAQTVDGAMAATATAVGKVEKTKINK